MKKIKLAVPSGIGDFSWIWSKLSTVPDVEWTFFVPDAYPQRTKQYVDLLPNCKGSLGQHNYNDILNWQRWHPGKTWEEILKTYDEGDVIYIEANKHLESGKPLNDWLPDLHVDFHYQLPTIEAQGLARVPILAFHMASIRGIRNWNAWLPETWAAFLTVFRQYFPDWQFIALGGGWDLDTVAELKGRLPDGFPLLDYVGKTSITEVINILNTADYYVGYSSGLNVIRNVLGKPCTALWPKHQIELMYSHVDPKQVASRNYMGFVYDTADRIFFRIKPKIKELVNHEQGACRI